MTAISPSQSSIQAALAAFLGAVLPGLSGAAPAVFVGAIAGTTLTITALPGKIPAGIQGTIIPFAPVLGPGVAPGTSIVAQLSGSTGGVGTYEVSISQTLDAATMSTGVTVIAGQANRAAEPANPYFVVMTPIRSPRLATNLDGNADVKFSGSIAGNTMTVTVVDTGTIKVGSTVFGTGVASNTTIQALGTGTGGTGTYQVSGSQTLTSRTLSAGAKTMTQDSEFVVQLDFHSPDTLAGDFAKAVSTSFRDEYATSFFAALSPPLNSVTPLYADDPEQRPFINENDQYEWRWVLEAHLEADQTVTVPQQYADAASITVVDVAASYH